MLRPLYATLILSFSLYYVLFLSASSLSYSINFFNNFSLFRTLFSVTYYILFPYFPFNFFSCQCYLLIFSALSNSDCHLFFLQPFLKICHGSKTTYTSTHIERHNLSKPHGFICTGALLPPSVCLPALQLPPHLRGGGFGLAALVWFGAKIIPLTVKLLS